MAKLNYFIYAVLILLILALLSRDAGFFSVDDLPVLPGSDKAEAPASPSTTPAEIPEPEIATLDLEYIRAVLSHVDRGQRQILLENPDTFREFVRQEATNRSLLAAARSNNLQANPDTRFLMQRRAQHTLMEIYLNRLIDNRMPEDFPNDEQLRQYYEENRHNMVLEERIHVWQIFLPLRENPDEAALNQVQSFAENLVSELQQGNIAYADAAVRHSAHAASRNNGGYMGLIKVSELLPAINEKLQTLAEGEISDPVRSATGLHILMRGAIVPPQEVTFEQVREQIANLLISQVRDRLRNAVLEQAANSFPVDLDDARIRDWWVDLSLDAAVRAAE